jgi:hypothetical protein
MLNAFWKGLSLRRGDVVFSAMGQMAPVLIACEPGRTCCGNASFIGVTLLIDRSRASHAQMARRVSHPAVQSRHLHQSHIFHMEDMLTA